MKKRVNELENRLIEIIQSKQQREKKIQNKCAMTRAPEMYTTISM